MRRQPRLPTAVRRPGCAAGCRRWSDLIRGCASNSSQPYANNGYNNGYNSGYNNTASAGYGTIESIQVTTADGRTSVGSGMLNALLDFGGNEGLGGSIGAGVGLARVKTRVGLSPTNRFNFRDTDRAMALQALAEVRYAVSPNLDVGIKYRYFRTATLDFGPFCVTTCGGIAYGLHGKYKSNSLLASLRYNFYQPAPPPPPPAPPAPPPPPATQTCPDGTVILVTSTCPEPPPPPAPPPPTERGQ